jgi:hypothetical protein
MFKKVFSIVAVLALSLGLAWTAAAQEAPKPGPEHKALDFFAGKWEFSADMKPGPMGPGGKVSTRDSCDWFEGGFALVCRGEGENPNGKTKSVAIMTYDTDKKAYTYYGVESGMPVAHAAGQKKGDTWVYEGDSGGMKSRVTVKETSPTSYSFKFEFSQDGTNWMTVMEGSAKKSTT